MSDSIIKVARRFLKEYKIKTLTVDKITEIIINGLELNRYIQTYSAFTYVDDKYRLVFLEDNLSEEETLVHLEYHL